nr:MAG: NP1 protein [Bocaparvovirus sp.]
MSGHHSLNQTQMKQYMNKKDDDYSDMKQRQKSTPPKESRKRSRSHSPRLTQKQGRGLSRSPSPKGRQRSFRDYWENRDNRDQGTSSQSPLKQIKKKMDHYRKHPSEKKARDNWVKKTSVIDTFVKFKAANNEQRSFCGFYWHSWRLAKKGTDRVFDEMKKEFQSRCKDGKVEWADVREMLFKFKKCTDKDYRSMLWHFRFTSCEKCDFWDDVYKKHMANVHYDTPQELTDAELLAAVEEAEASPEK